MMEQEGWNNLAIYFLEVLLKEIVTESQSKNKF
jgi:hypothetical protein